MAAAETPEQMVARAEQLETRANDIDYRGACQLPGDDSPQRMRDRARYLREQARKLRLPRPPVRFG